MSASNVYQGRGGFSSLTSALRDVDEGAGDDSEVGLQEELDSDVSVLAPGAVILPTAIYK